VGVSKKNRNNSGLLGEIVNVARSFIGQYTVIGQLRGTNRDWICTKPFFWDIKEHTIQLHLQDGWRSFPLKNVCINIK
jgi:hypothetical protein